MFSRVKSAVSMGYHTNLIEIETHITRGLPHYSVVGLPSAIIRESKERVRSALKSSGQIYPDERITQSLFPAYEKKEGSQLDLPLAVGIFCAVNGISTGEILFLGELSLDGRIKSIQGIVNYILSFPKDTVFVLPEDCREEIEIFEFGTKALYYSALSDLISDLKSKKISISSANTDSYTDSNEMEDINSSVDFSEVRGQHDAIRKLQIAAVGSFHTLIFGPPGCGKTMISTRFPGILPTPEKSEMIEISRIYGSDMLGKRPIRNPHHSITKVGLIGGGNRLKIGEISKAHRGVLVLDEFGEYPRHIIELLREPLETGEIRIARAGESVTFPAKFLLVATMNPCFCGRYHRYSMGCNCDQTRLKQYYSRLSWPLIDRMGIFIEMDKVDLSDSYSKSSRVLREEVEKAIEFGRHLDIKERITKGFEYAVEEIYSKKNMTMRSIELVRRVAKCIADLDQSIELTKDHLLEASSLNPAENLKTIYQE